MAVIYIDAATKQNPHFSVGACVVKGDSLNFEETFILGNIDNNEAEWATLLKTTELLLSFHVSTAIIYTDSKIITDTFNKNYVKDKKFRSYYDKIMVLRDNFQLFLVSLVPREENRHADSLAKTRLYKELK